MGLASSKQVAAFGDPMSVTIDNDIGRMRKSLPRGVRKDRSKVRPLLNVCLVGKPLPGGPGNEALKPVKRMALDVALIEPEGELVNVAVQMFRAGVVVDADQTTLENRENALDAVRGDAIADELGSAVIARKSSI